MEDEVNPKKRFWKLILDAIIFVLTGLAGFFTGCSVHGF